MHVLNLSRPHLGDKHNYYGGSIGSITYNQFRALADQGVTLDTYYAGTDLAHPLPRNLSLLDSNSGFDVRRHVRTGADAYDVLTHMYFFETAHNIAARAAARSETPLVIGMAEPPHPRFSDELEGIRRFKTVRSIGRVALLPLFKRTLRYADRIVTVNERGKEYYAQYVPESKIEVVPYGVDTNRFEPSPYPDNSRILVVSRLIRRRGIQHLVRALPRIADTVRDVEVHLVGDGPRRADLESLAAELGVADRLQFHGNIGPAELGTQYRRASLLCHLSFADGWNQPALEAMASGRPVVCVDASHNSMVVDGETGFKVPWNDPDAVCDYVTRILADSGLGAEMGRLARRTVEREYEWERAATDYASIFKDVI